MDPIATRLRYITAFNATMAKIWKERLALLGVIDTGALYNSVVRVAMSVNSDGSEVNYAWGFLDYGLYQDSGTGREKWIGNPGDIGEKTKKGKYRNFRERRPWFSKSFYSSTMNLKEFMASSLGQQAMSVLSSAFADPIVATP